jgi:hypothetical protein
MSRALPRSFELDQLYHRHSMPLSGDTLPSRQRNDGVACSGLGQRRPRRRAPDPSPPTAPHLVDDAFGAAETTRPRGSLADYHLRPVPSLLRCLNHMARRIGCPSPNVWGGQ